MNDNKIKVDFVRLRNLTNKDGKKKIPHLQSKYGIQVFIF
ncbi:MAG: hypothetical protein ACI8ZM_002037 [Crocinitomix sp.]|jgi:hypothetical protein